LIVSQNPLAPIQALATTVYKWKQLYASWNRTPAHMPAYGAPDEAVAAECRGVLYVLEMAGGLAATWLSGQGVDPTPLLRWLMVQRQPNTDHAIVAALLDEAQISLQRALHQYQAREAPAAPDNQHPADTRPAKADWPRPWKRVWDALAAGPKSARGVAKQAGFKWGSHVRSVLANMVNAGVLVKAAGGYARVPAPTNVR
jgi:hypothetical protein